MPMNSFTYRRGRGPDDKKKSDDELTATGYEITTTGNISDDSEVTEITVRIRAVDAKAVESHYDFDINQVRGTDIENVDVDKLEKDYKDPQGRRHSPRYKKALTTIIYTPKGSFRTTTLNVSVGGALLADSLPAEFMKGPIEILFIHEDEDLKQYFMFQGEALVGHRDNTRVQFKTGSKTAQDTLASLLKHLGPSALVA